MGSLYYLCSFNIPCPSVTANMETPELVFVLFFGEGGGSVSPEGFALKLHFK